MKSFTDIEQSNKLAKILPPESADHNYLRKVRNENAVDGEWNFFDTDYEIVPCWSLSTLLELLPSATLDTSDNHHYRMQCCGKFTEWYDTAVDAAVAMIKRLKRQNEL